MSNLFGMKWLHPDQFCWCVEQGFCISMENRERLKTMHPPSSKTLYCGTQNQAINLAINLFFFFIYWLQLAQIHIGHIVPAVSNQPHLSNRILNKREEMKTWEFPFFSMADFLFACYTINSQEKMEILHQCEMRVLSCRTPGNQISNY